jgi:multimeric flavodoxin WrbA
MRALAITGSARRGGNTAALLNRALEGLEKEGFETGLVELGGKILRGCTACRSCYANKNKKCVIETDELNNILGKMIEADVILIGSPTYFADVSAETKALIDRAGYVSRANGDLFTRKLGAAVIMMRRAGAIHAFDTINHFFLISGMMVAGSSYWNIGIGREIGDAAGDEEGLKTMDTLASNLAWAAKRLSGKSPVSETRA